MYDMPQYLKLAEIAEYLGIGRNKALTLCQQRPNGFPAVKVGNRYQSDRSKLAKWRDDWYAGKFELGV